MTFVAIPLFFFTAFFEKSGARDKAYPTPTPKTLDCVSVIQFSGLHINKTKWLQTEVGLASFSWFFQNYIGILTDLQ